MNESEIANEIHSRLLRDIEHCNGELPNGHALAWTGYLAALCEWNLITLEAYQKLGELLPNVSDDPAVRILLDRPPKHCADAN